MPTFSLSPDGDLILTERGSLLMVSGKEEAIQRIIRRIVTNPGDYIYHPNYGLGLGSLVNGVLTGDICDKIKSLIRQGVMEDTDAIKEQEPSITEVERTFDTITVSTSFLSIYGEQVNFTLAFAIPSP